jgi:molybdopterin-dependent oxidoreductase alpha subunit
LKIHEEPRVMADEKARYKIYTQPAGGWGAAAATAKVLLEQSVVTKGSRALLAMNQPGGFKCPSCAFPDATCTKTLEFCENGAKALAHEATKFRVTREFFAQHSVTELMEQSDYWLEMQGRLTEPMRYDAATDHYVPVSWDDAFALIGQHLRALDSPDEAEFYTSGRTPNEAAFLYSIFVREYGTNNFPDCSNMCHEPTSRGLPHSIGVGKGTVILDDFEHAEAIFVIGQNSGTNSPRMMTNLVEARKRGVPIVAVNPMPERALIRFTEPQDMVQMATFGSTPIASEFVHIKIGGDLALFKGMMRVMFEREAAGEAVFDQAFIAQHTEGFSALRDDIMGQSWPDLVRHSGIDEDQIRRCAEIYIRSNATIICYGMGITQHLRSRIFCCSRAIMASPARAFRPFAAIPTCRAIAPSASTKGRALPISTGCAIYSVSNRRAIMAIIRWNRSKRCWPGRRRCLSVWAAISSARCPTPTAPMPRCGN